VGTVPFDSDPNCRRYQAASRGMGGIAR
jgi:hypothetical protein